MYLQSFGMVLTALGLTFMIFGCITESLLLRCWAIFVLAMAFACSVIDIIQSSIGGAL